MSHILERLARVVPPRQGNWRAIACNTATAAVELDNDVFQFALAATALGGPTPGLPGNYGKALLRVQAEGNDLWINFGPTSSVQANSALLSANAAMHIPVNQERDFEVDPALDKFLSAVTQNGSGNTATCRYGIVSFGIIQYPRT
jgi:hypothetical protein